MVGMREEELQHWVEIGASPTLIFRVGLLGNSNFMQCILF